MKADVLNMTYFPSTYSNNETLKIFLNSLSYHQEGAVVFADIIEKTINTRQTIKLLDIGCGTGLFTLSLLKELKSRGHDLTKFTFFGFDPDTENIKTYLATLSDYVACEAIVSSMEDFETKSKWDFVISSHSLYQSLENPYTSESEKITLLSKLHQWRCKNGVIICSMASQDSQAYRFKESIHQLIERENISSYIENLQCFFAKLGCISGRSNFKYINSYMDVTRLFNDDQSLYYWVSYFCRLDQNFLATIDRDELITQLKIFSECFSSLPEELRNRYKKYHAETGTPNNLTKILRHKEGVIWIK